MARRRLFSDEHWAGLFALPADERAIVRPGVTHEIEGSIPTG